MAATGLQYDDATVLYQRDTASELTAAALMIWGTVATMVVAAAFGADDRLIIRVGYLGLLFGAGAAGVRRRKSARRVDLVVAGTIGVFLAMLGTMLSAAPIGPAGHAVAASVAFVAAAGVAHLTRAGARLVLPIVYRRRRSSPEANRSFVHLLCAGFLGPALSLATAPMYQISASGLALVLTVSVMGSAAVAAYVTGSELRHASSRSRFCRIKCADAAAAGGCVAGILLASSLPAEALDAVFGSALSAAVPPTLLFAVATGALAMSIVSYASRPAEA